MDARIALIADGRLVLVKADGSSKRHDCEFAADIERREQRSAEKNSWLRGEEGGPGQMFSRSSLWGSRGSSGPSIPPRIVAVTNGERAGELVYALWTGVVGAMLEYDFEENYERRVFHREGFHALELDRHAGDGRLVCRLGDDSESNLAVLDPDGRNAKMVTEGDSVDAAPAWVPGTKATIVYHSAGLSRDQRGFIQGLGPFSIHRIDLEKGELETLVESLQHDLLSPHFDAEGNLYYIRRNYEGPGGRRPSGWVTLKDTLLYPFRVIRAIVDFTQMFSMIVSRKPLTTAGGPKAQGPEPVRMWIHGRMIDVQKASEANAPDGALAPADWELVRRSPDGTETTLAKHVLAYDLSEDGEIAWSDGKNLHTLKAGAKKKVMTEPLIQSVKWLEAFRGE